MIKKMDNGKRKKYLLTALILLLLLIGILIVRQTVGIYHSFRQVKFPTHERREENRPNIHSWMTVSEVADQYGITGEEVFEYLGITPQPGDDKLTLRALREKYEINPDEMQRSLKRMMDNSSGRRSQ